eukprot:gene9739-18238_t
MIDRSIPSERNVSIKEVENLSKYKDLEIEVTKMWEMKTSTVPIVVGALGLVKRGLEKYASQIPGHIQIEELQKIALLISAHILRRTMSIKVKASMKKCLYKVVLQLSVKSGDVCSAACTCPAGIGLRGFGNCNHVGSVLFALEDFNRRGLREYPSAVTWTSKLSFWNVPNSSALKSINPFPVDEVLKLVGNCLPHLGASLDGEVTYKNETWRFEIKCPFSEFNMSLQEALKNKKFFLVEVGASPSIDEEQEEARSTKEPVKLKPNRKRQS